MKKHYNSIWHTIKGLWWWLIGAKRFRVIYYDDGRLSRLMTYYDASNYAKIFGGQVCIDNNKKLLP